MKHYREVVDTQPDIYAQAITEYKALSRQREKLEQELYETSQRETEAWHRLLKIERDLARGVLPHAER